MSISIFNQSRAILASIPVLSSFLAVVAPLRACFPRAFAPRPVDRQTVRSLLEAARWAPSAFNAQPWAFLVATTDEAETHARLAEVLLPFNRAWAAQAPVLLVGLTRDTSPRDGSPNPLARYDLGQAMAWLSMQAQAMGLHVHQMAGFDAAAVRSAYDLPGEVTPVVAAAVGYLGEPDSLDPALAARERAPRTRNPQSTFVFGAGWESPW